MRCNELLRSRLGVPYDRKGALGGAWRMGEIDSNAMEYVLLEPPRCCECAFFFLQAFERLFVCAFHSVVLAAYTRRKEQFIRIATHTCIAHTASQLRTNQSSRNKRQNRTRDVSIAWPITTNIKRRLIGTSHGFKNGRDAIQIVGRDQRRVERQQCACEQPSTHERDRKRR